MTDSAWRWFEDEHIPLKARVAGVSLEPRPVKLNAFTSTCPLVYANPVCNADRIAHVEVSYVRGLDQFDTQLLVPRETPAVPSTTHVTTLACWVAALHDVRAVVLIGCDYALAEDGTRYCDGRMDDEDRMVTKVAAIGGGEATSLMNYRNAVFEMESVAKKLTGIEILPINASGRGCAHIEGWVNCTVGHDDEIPSLFDTLNQLPA